MADTTLPGPHRPTVVAVRPLDPQAARRIFDAHDRGRTGFLGPAELLRVAEEVWREGHPAQSVMSGEGREVTTGQTKSLCTSLFGIVPSHRERLQCSLMFARPCSEPVVYFLAGASNFFGGFTKDLQSESFLI